MPETQTSGITQEEMYLAAIFASVSNGTELHDELIGMSLSIEGLAEVTGGKLVGDDSKDAVARLRPGRDAGRSVSYSDIVRGLRDSGYAAGPHDEPGLYAVINLNLPAEGSTLSRVVQRLDRTTHDEMALVLANNPVPYEGEGHAFTSSLVPASSDNEAREAYNALRRGCHQFEFGLRGGRSAGKSLDEMTTAYAAMTTFMASPTPEGLVALKQHHIQY